MISNLRDHTRHIQCDEFSFVLFLSHDIPIEKPLLLYERTFCRYWVVHYQAASNITTPNNCNNLDEAKKYTSSSIMAVIVSSRNHFDSFDKIETGETLRLGEITCQICPIDEDTKDRKLSLSRTFFTEQRDLVSEILLFLDPSSMFKLCRAIPSVRPVLTHDHVIRSVAKTMETDTYNLDNPCYRRKRHQYRHIQYHRMVVEKMIPKFQRQALTRQSPMQLLRAVSGRYCERCQLDLVCVTGW